MIFWNPSLTDPAWEEHTIISRVVVLPLLMASSLTSLPGSTLITCDSSVNERRLDTTEEKRMEHERMWTVWEPLMVLLDLSLSSSALIPGGGSSRARLKSHRSDPWLGVCWRCWSSGGGCLFSPPPTGGPCILGADAGTSHTLPTETHDLISSECTVYWGGSGVDLFTPVHGFWERVLQPQGVFRRAEHKVLQHQEAGAFTTVAFSNKDGVHHWQLISSAWITVEKAAWRRHSTAQSQVSRIKAPN